MTDLGAAAPFPVARQRATAITAVDLLADSFEAIRTAVETTVDGLHADQLAYRPSPTSNSITWLVWHLTRLQDDQVARAVGRDQVWHTGDWAARFALPFDAESTGSGQDPEEAATVWVESGALLTDYHRAVNRETLRSLAHLSDADLSRVVDERQGPQVTLGIRLIAVVRDDLQHIGQAGYVRGLLGHGPFGAGPTVSRRFDDPMGHRRDATGREGVVRPAVPQ